MIHLILTGCCTILLAAAAPQHGAKPKKADPPIENLKPIDARWADRIQLAPQRFELPNSSPSPIAGYVDAQRRMLSAKIENAAAPADEMELRLAAANWELAAAAATPVSRILLGIDQQPKNDRLATLTQAAKAHLDKVDKWLQSAEDLDDDHADALALQLMRLRAFQQTLASLAQPANEQTEKGVNELLIATAILLEDSRPDVVAAAELYQGFVLGRAGRARRGLKILKPALAKATSSKGNLAINLSMMGKLLRLRLLNASGLSDAAWPLSLRLGEHVSDWIKNKPMATEANTALALLRLDTMAALQNRAEAAGNKREQQWLDGRIKSLEDEWFAKARQPSVFRLNLAVPIIASVDDRPTTWSIFGLPTAARSIVFVADLSDSITDTQRNELIHRIENGLNKLDETGVFAVLATCQPAPCFYGEKKLQKADDDAIQTATTWLSKQMPEKPSPLSAAVAEAVKLSSVQIIVLTDRPFETSWVAPVAAAAKTTAIDVVHVADKDSAPPPPGLSAPTIRVEHIDRLAAPKPAKPKTEDEENTEPPAETTDQKKIEAKTETKPTAPPPRDKNDD